MLDPISAAWNAVARSTTMRLPSAVDQLSDDGFRSASSISQKIWNEMASLNANCGPPFRAANFWPLSSNSTAMTAPAGPGPASVERNTLPSFECSKMLV